MLLLDRAYMHTVNRGTDTRGEGSNYAQVLTNCVIDTPSFSILGDSGDEAKYTGSGGVYASASSPTGLATNTGAVRTVTAGDISAIGAGRALQDVPTSAWLISMVMGGRGAQLVAAGSAAGVAASVAVGSVFRMDFPPAFKPSFNTSEFRR